MTSDNIEKTIFNWRDFESVICPNCGSCNVAMIQYGLPKWSMEFEEKLNAGVIVMGGCMLSPDNPVYECNECRIRWGRLYDEHKEFYDNMDKLKKRETNK